MHTQIPKKGRLNQIYIEKDKTKMKKLICVWCGDIFLQPQRLYCGHTVCRQCIENEIVSSKKNKNSMKCIICGSLVEEDEIGEDRIGKLIVQNIKVRCPSNKCNWQGLNKDFLQHYQHQCQHNQRIGELCYDYTYFSKGTEFNRKLNDDEQKKQHKLSMLHQGVVLTLREKMEKQWETQRLFNEQQQRRKMKRFSKTFGR